jgi:hypothetical protein
MAELTIDRIELSVDDYRVTDTFFGAPYIDADEVKDQPTLHRSIHGGFEGTGTRFSLSFIPSELFEGRFIQPLDGGLGGNEYVFCKAKPDGIYGAIGGLDFALPLGAYMVESNQGHVGSELCPKAGDDGTIYGWRASAETGRFAKHLAVQIYGRAPHHGYVFGASGGGQRSAQCIENVHDVWDGAAPAEGGIGISGGVSEPGGLAAPFATMFNTQMMLGDRLAQVVDAVEPGGSGQPFEGLTYLQREALHDLYKSGFPRGVEWMVAYPAGQIGLWAWSADQWYVDDPEYYDEFWSTPGYLGHDLPQVFGDLLISDVTTTVRRVLLAGDLRDLPPDAPELQAPLIAMGRFLYPRRLPIAIVLDGLDGGYLQGASLRVMTGKAAGRQLYCTSVGGEVLIGDGIGADGNARFTDVEPGDQILVDNRRYLAFCSRYRHLTNPADPNQAHLVVDGVPIHPQRPGAGGIGAAHMGAVSFTGKFTGKVLHTQHAHDSSIWPRAENPADHVKDRYVIRWLENAEHTGGHSIPVGPPPVPSTRLIEFKGANQQNLHDLVAWVENDVTPVGTTYSLSPGGVLRLPSTAAERGGIQPVVEVTANGGPRADVKAGEPVVLGVVADVPPGTGTITDVRWDFDGTGAWPQVDDGIDGTAARLEAKVTHVYDSPGTYFAAVRVTSHRDGDVHATSRQVENIGRARVVVT